MHYTCRMPRSGLVLPAGRISSGNRRDDRHFMNRRYLFVPICGVTKKNGISGSRSMTEVRCSLIECCAN